MKTWKGRLLPLMALALCLTACAPTPAPTPAATPTLTETAAPAPTATPAPTPDPGEPVIEYLDALLDEGSWRARFWIFPGTGPMPVTLPEAEYGEALRALFAAYDWKEISYEDTRRGEDFSYPPDAYSFQFLCGYPAPDGPQTISVGAYDSYLQMGIRKEDGSYGSRYFTAEGAENLCDDIADLWPGWEAVTGCRTRVSPQETKEALARAYLEATFDKLRENGHIADARIDSVEIRPWAYDGMEWVESDGTSVDGSESMLFRTVFSLRPSHPELTYWQEQGVDKDGWASYELSKISLSQWGDDGLYELGWFE